MQQQKTFVFADYFRCFICGSIRYKYYLQFFRGIIQFQGIINLGLNKIFLIPGGNNQ